MTNAQLGRGFSSWKDVHLESKVAQSMEVAKGMSSNKAETDQAKLRMAIVYLTKRKLKLAVSTWMIRSTRELKEELIDMAQTANAFGNKETYEVMVHKLLTLDRAVLDTRSQLVIRAAAALQHGCMQGAWSTWRSEVVHSMMAQHVEIVEKLWERQKEQDEEISALRQGGKIGGTLDALREENEAIKAENAELKHKTMRHMWRTMAESDEVLAVAQREKEALQGSHGELALALDSLLRENDAIKQAALMEQQEFIKVFKKLTKQRREDRRTALLNILILFGRKARGEAFSRWRGTVALSQLNGALKLIDSANDQLRKVIDHAEVEKSVAPALRRQLAAAEKEKMQLQSAVERNMQYTQALVTNLSFLRSTVPEMGNRQTSIVDDILNQAMQMDASIQAVATRR